MKITAIMESDVTYESFLDNARLARAIERAEKMELIARVEQYTLLLDRVEEGEFLAEEALEEFLVEFPNIMNYDNKGNYIGNVRNENGWTP